MRPNLREKISLMNIRRASSYISKKGQVAILDATNVSLKRREKISLLLNGYPLLFIECINGDKDILEASIQRKASLPEFNHLKREDAIQIFKQRIDFFNQVVCCIFRFFF